MHFNERLILRRWLHCLLPALVLFAGQLMAQDAAMVWSLEQIVKSEDDPVLLRNSRGTLVRRLDATVPRYIYVVARDIVRSSETEAEFFLTTGNEPNASAGVVRGKNTVLINLGMLDMIGADMHQWAALIGHEIAHITLEHQDQRLERLAPQVLLQVISYGVISDPALRDLTNMAFQAYETSFSREAERESDYMGVIWAVESGYDPHGAVDLHEAFRRRGSEHPVPFLSTHPSGSERIVTLQRLADRLDIDR
jgi:predicted Zn-dependent protease